MARRHSARPARCRLLTCGKGGRARNRWSRRSVDIVAESVQCRRGERAGAVPVAQGGPSICAFMQAGADVCQLSTHSEEFRVRWPRTTGVSTAPVSSRSATPLSASWTCATRRWNSADNVPPFQDDHYLIVSSVFPAYRRPHSAANAPTSAPRNGSRASPGRSAAPGCRTAASGWRCGHRVADTVRVGAGKRSPT
jgi:hypothetical protein